MMYLANNDVIQQLRSFSIDHITAELRDQFQAGIASESQSSSRVLTVSGDIATVNINGVLTQNYGFMTWLMGGTAYDDVMKAFEFAENDAEIKRIEIKMNSGGGQVAGLFELIAQMQAMKKPVSCFVSGMCCSAAYAIASQCSEIIAASEGEGFGSVGIVVDMHIDESMKSITSSNAPKKRPDPMSAEGETAIREELDAYEELFIEAIASGRKTTAANVVDFYGKGAVTTARKALKSGMIDSIQSRISTAQGTEHNLTANSGETMNIAELQAKHPELFAEVKALGHKEGVTAERGRVDGFIELGAATGADDLMMACIKDGSEFSASLNAKFNAEFYKNQKLNALVEDNADTNGVDTAAKVEVVEVNDDAATIAAFNALHNQVEVM